MSNQSITSTHTFRTIKEGNIRNMLFLLKILSLFFAATPYFEKFSSSFITQGLIDYKSNLIFALFALGIIGVVMLLWWAMNEAKYKYRHVMWIEIFAFFAIFTITFYYTGGIESSHKYLYLILIVTYTIEMGQAVGITLASLTSIMILSIDLLHPNAPAYFQIDLATSGLFILIAWTLGYYVKLENTHIAYLTDIANMDGLTGVYNHRYFHEFLQTLCEQRINEPKPLSLILLDLDFFKEYNDLFGHQKGDELLVAISQIMKRHTPESALHFRYGGDEFCVVLDNTQEDIALQISEELRIAISEYAHDGMEHLPSKKLTASIGVASLSEDVTTYLSLIDKADSALYRAKYLRKNRVESYGDVWKIFKNLSDPNMEETFKYAKTLISVIDAKDKYTYFHIERVAHNCELFADYLGLSDKEKKQLIFGAYLHDLGKLNISKEILISDKRLTDSEWNELKSHPVESASIIGNIGGFDDIIPIVKYHHERYDGKGYPENLAGEEIPALARLLSVVDSFDAMTNKRPYQKTKSIDEGLLELERCAGEQFDPYYVTAFVQMIRDSIK